MPILDKEKRTERKNVRQQRRVAQKQMKDFELGQQVRKEAKGYGVDIDKPLDIGPMGAERKAAIDERISKLATDEQKKRMKPFMDLTRPSDVTAPAQLDETALKENLRKQKRARWWDALYAFGEGLQGRTADPKAMRSKQLKAEREAMYDQYKESFKSGKQRLGEWEDKYRQDAIDYLNQKLKDPNTTELEKIKLDQEKARLESIQADVAYKKKRAGLLGKDKSIDAKGDAHTFTRGVGDDKISIKVTDKADAFQMASLMGRKDNLEAEKKALVDKMETEMYNVENKPGTMLGRGLGWDKTRGELQEEIRLKYQETLDAIDEQMKTVQDQYDAYFDKYKPKADKKETKQEDELWNL